MYSCHKQIYIGVDERLEFSTILPCQISEGSGNFKYKSHGFETCGILRWDVLSDIETGTRSSAIHFLAHNKTLHGGPAVSSQI